MIFSRFRIFKNEKNRTIALAVFASVVIVATILFQAGIVGGPDKVQPGEKTFATEVVGGHWYEAEKKLVPVYHVAAGTVRSREEASITSRLPAARITDVKVRSGDMVKQGDILVELDSSDLKSAVDSAGENLRQQKSRQVFAQQKYDRIASLQKSGAVSRQDFDAALSDLNAANAATAMLQHNLDSAMLSLGYATIRSPFDGIVYERLVDPGNMGTLGAVLVRMFAPDKLEMRLQVPESLALKLKAGDILETRIESLDKTVPARVIEVSPAVDPGSRTFQVNTMLAGDAAGIMPGMFGRTSLKIGEKQAVVIPDSAIRRVGQLEYVTVRSSTGVVNDIMVRTAPAAGGQREVISGLQAGDAYLMPMP